MKKNWLQKKINEYASLKGYQKPEKYSGSLKLDSNENFVSVQVLICLQV